MCIYIPDSGIHALTPAQPLLLFRSARLPCANSALSGTGWRTGSSGRCNRAASNGSGCSGSQTARSRALDSPLRRRFFFFWLWQRSLDSGSSVFASSFWCGSALVRLAGCSIFTFLLFAMAYLQALSGGFTTVYWSRRPLLPPSPCCSLHEEQTTPAGRRGRLLWPHGCHLNLARPRLPPPLYYPAVGCGSLLERQLRPMLRSRSPFQWFFSRSLACRIADLKLVGIDVGKVAVSCCFVGGGVQPGVHGCRIPASAAAAAR